MRWLTRIGNLLSANIDDLIERYEDPELLLREAIRHMEATLDRALIDAVNVLAQEKLLAGQVADAKRESKRCHAAAEAALQTGNESAARQALRRKRTHDSLDIILANQRKEAAGVGAVLRAHVDELQFRLEQAKGKRLLLTARQRAATARQRVLNALADRPTEDLTFETFDRMAQRVLRTEATAEALAELTAWHSSASKWSELDDDMETEHELSALQVAIAARTPGGGKTDG